MSIPRRTVLVALVLGAVLAGCGRATTERSRVSAYIRHVQTVEQAMSPLLKKTTQAISQFATAQHHRVSLISNLSLVTIKADLHGTLVQLVELRRRLAAVPAPPAAGHLRRLVLQLADAQSSLTRQAYELVGFVRPFTAASQEVAPAIRRLQAILVQSGTYTQASAAVLSAQKSAALRQFSRRMAGISRQLRGLRPPPVSRPGYRTELRSVDAMGSAASKLAGALSTGAAAQLEAQLTAFDKAATLGRTAAAQRAQIAAVRTYDRHVAQLNRLAADIDQERTRLDATLA